ncbi:hypothetical protein [Nocardia sputi]|uniref:hypothetical protein n=1 Tax=Nocardia sputi TaxID=2943705 RepID=UPI0020BDBE83|nr:hypothetical protein [Nocardia sputi]
MALRPICSSNRGRGEQLGNRIEEVRRIAAGLFYLIGIPLSIATLPLWPLGGGAGATRSRLGSCSAARTSGAARSAHPMTLIGLTTSSLVAVVPQRPAQPVAANR